MVKDSAIISYDTQNMFDYDYVIEYLTNELGFDPRLVRDFRTTKTYDKLIEYLGNDTSNIKLYIPSYVTMIKIPHIDTIVIYSNSPRAFKITNDSITEFNENDFINIIFNDYTNIINNFTIDHASIYVIIPRELMDFLNKYYVNMWNNSDYHFEHIILKSDISKIIATYFYDLNEFGKENTHETCYKFDKSLVTLFKHSYKNNPIISKNTLDYHINEMLRYRSQPLYLSEQEFVTNSSVQTELEELEELENYKEHDMLYINILLFTIIVMWYFF